MIGSLLTGIGGMLFGKKGSGNYGLVGNALGSYAGSKASIEASRGLRDSERALNRDDAQWEMEKGHDYWTKRRQAESGYAITDMQNQSAEFMRQRDAYADRYRAHDMADIQASSMLQADIEKKFFADSLEIETNAAKGRMDRLYPGATTQELLGAGGYGPSGAGSGTSVGNGSQQMAQDAQAMSYEKANMESNTALAIEQIRGQTARDVAKIQTQPARAEIPIKQKQADTAAAAQEIQAYLAHNKVEIDWDKWKTEKPTKTEAFILINSC